MALEMLGMNVLVKVVREEKTKSGLVLTTTSRRGPLEEAKVLKVGCGEDDKDIQGIDVGDTVIIDSDFAKPIKYNGEECFVLHFKDILGVDKVKE